MSFLASLRQGAPAISDKPSLKLVYLFSVHKHRVHVSLELAELVNGHIQGNRKPYHIQPQHLTAPPAYLNQCDIELLSLLSADHNTVSDKALQASEMAQTFDRISLPFFHAALATQSAYLIINSKCVLLTLGESRVMPLQWRINGDGAQSLAWSCKGYVTLLDTQFFNIDADGLVCPIQHEHLNDALPFFQNTVDADQIDLFLDQYQSQLELCGLPIPLRIPRQSASGASHWVLNCLQIGGEDYVQLENHRYTESVSIRFYCSSESHRVNIWDGVCLQEFESSLNEFKQVYGRVSAELVQWQEIQPGVWKAANPKLWIDEFPYIKKRLHEDGFRFYEHPSFESSYTLLDDWQVNLSAELENYELDLFGVAGDHRVDLFTILEQLKEQRLQSLERGEFADKSSSNSFQVIEYIGKKYLIPIKLCGFLSEEFADLLRWQNIRNPIPLNQIYRVNSLRKNLPDAQWSGDSELIKRSECLSQTPPVVDVSQCRVNADLRPYQWLGVCWLQHLKASGMNGLLADDMGLGKTLQTLAHLSLDLSASSASISLIVAPTSLLNNWMQELQKFCPHLKAVICHGADRKKLLAQLNSNASKYQIVVTSYQTIVNDLAFWQERSLNWLVLDEAQSIKNPNTQVRKALVTLQSDHKLCLSGTPVENHLGELWSILDFLNPGMLGNATQFRTYYQKPIEQEQNGERMSLLLRRVGPVILRRTKQQVASDLPEKTVISMPIPIGDEQQKLYDRIKEEALEQIAEDLQSDLPKGQKQIRLLSGITKLRQAACDPALLGEDVESAKKSACVDMVRELVEEGRAVLIFSQFTKMLGLLEQELSSSGVPFFTLTGKTRNRAELVERFQGGERPVFLISLKAGGVGLNLTRADTVIHFDPWWNSAAQEQASDRAHRIGQTQPIFVYKLIAEGTIEERIEKMQNAKASLSGQVHREAQENSENFALKYEQLLELVTEEDTL